MESVPSRVERLGDAGERGPCSSRSSSGSCLSVRPVIQPQLLSHRSWESPSQYPRQQAECRNTNSYQGSPASCSRWLPPRRYRQQASPRLFHHTYTAPAKKPETERIRTKTEEAKSIKLSTRQTRAANGTTLAVAVAFDRAAVGKRVCSWVTAHGRLVITTRARVVYNLRPHGRHHPACGWSPIPRFVHNLAV